MQAKKAYTKTKKCSAPFCRASSRLAWILIDRPTGDSLYLLTNRNPWNIEGLSASLVSGVDWRSWYATPLPLYLLPVLILQGGHKGCFSGKQEHHSPRRLQKAQWSLGDRAIITLLETHQHKVLLAGNALNMVRQELETEG